MSDRPVLRKPTPATTPAPDEAAVAALWRERVRREAREYKAGRGGYLSAIEVRRCATCGRRVSINPRIVLIGESLPCCDGTEAYGASLQIPGPVSPWHDLKPETWFAIALLGEDPVRRGSPIAQKRRATLHAACARAGLLFGSEVHP